MTDEKMLELAERAAVTTNWKPWLDNKHVREYMRKFAALVRREALEEAAAFAIKEGDSCAICGEHHHAEGAYHVGGCIRALAAQEKL